MSGYMINGSRSNEHMRHECWKPGGCRTPDLGSSDVEKTFDDDSVADNRHALPRFPVTEMNLEMT